MYEYFPELFKLFDKFFQSIGFKRKSKLWIKEYDKYMRNHLTQAEKDYLEIMGEDIKKLKSNFLYYFNQSAHHCINSLFSS